MISFIMAGIVVSKIYIQSIKNNTNNFFVWMLPLVCGIIIFAVVTRAIAGISKINDTPAWVGICTGISIIAFALLIFIVDFKEKAKWFSILKPAGTSTLTCCLLPYFLYFMLTVCNIEYPYFFNDGIGGIIRSFATTLIIIILRKTKTAFENLNF